MKKRILSVLLAVCMVFGLLPGLTQPAMAAESKNIADGSLYFRESGGALQYYAGTVAPTEGSYWTTYTGTFTITGDATDDDVATNTVVVTSGTHNITLWGCSIGAATAENNTVPDALSPFDIRGGTVNLTLVGENKLYSAHYGCAGLSVKSEATLNISGSGSLDARCQKYYPTGGMYGTGAGIGGNAMGVNGEITISGGTVSAYSSNGAGIGSGYNVSGSFGTITINGGTVYAKSDWACGIGYGTQASTSGTVTITGGSVNAVLGQPVNPKPKIGGTVKNGASSPVDVVLYTLTLSGVSAGTEVTELSLPDGYAYDTTGMQTDADGKLYVYLPSDTSGDVIVTTDSGAYEGAISDNTAILEEMTTPNPTPSAVFTATGSNIGTLSNVTTGMKYSVNGGSAWSFITGTTMDITGVTAASGVQIMQPGNGSTTTDSLVQTITVTQAAAPTLSATQPSTIGGNGSIPMTTEHEYSSNSGDTWTSASGTTTLASGTYLVRVKATGTVLASEAQSVTLTAYTGTPATTPSASFSFDGADAGMLTGTTTQMKYSLDDGSSWTSCADTSTDLSGVIGNITAGNGIKVKDMGNGTTTSESAVQSINITQAATPALSPTQPSTIGGSGSIPMTTEHEYSSNSGGTWTSASGTTTLASGTYLVRVKATGIVLASEAQSVTLTAYTGIAETTPSAVVDYATEKLTSLTANGSYAINGADITADGVGNIAIANAWFGAAISLVKKGDGTTTNDSAAQSISLTARPAAPSCTVTQPSASSATGAISGVTADMEFSTDDGIIWTDGTGSDITGLALGTVLIRVKAISASAPTGMSQSITITAYSAPSHSDSGGSSSAAPVASTTISAAVIVDGKTQNIGTEQKSGDTTTVTVDQSKLGENIGGAAAGSSVVVPVSGNGAATASLVVQNIEDMAAKDMTLTVQTGNVAYNLNTAAIDTSALTAAFPGTDMSKVPFDVTIQSSSVSVVGETLVLPPVAFTVTATYNGRTVSVDSFSAYIDRAIEVTAEQAAKITTAVVVNADGSTRHVPTNVVQRDGKWYAIINSRTNSTYALIQNEVTFADAKGKWYEATVNEMGSRKIIGGRSASVFDGEAGITRAEFSAILVRALGLPADGASTFSDVSASEWYAGAAATAAQYGIVGGKGDNRFDPSANITRQEAMLMLQRAAALTKFTGASSTLDSFADAGSIDVWAQGAAKWSVGSGLFQGTDGKLNPTASITRAESAATVLRLLQKAGLVDVRS